MTRHPGGVAAHIISRFRNPTRIVVEPPKFPPAPPYVARVPPRPVSNDHIPVPRREFNSSSPHAVPPIELFAPAPTDDRVLFPRREFNSSSPHAVPPIELIASTPEHVPLTRTTSIPATSDLSTPTRQHPYFTPTRTYPLSHAISTLRFYDFLGPPHRFSRSPRTRHCDNGEKDVLSVDDAAPLIHLALDPAQWIQIASTSALSVSPAIDCSLPILSSSETRAAGGDFKTASQRPQHRLETRRVARATRFSVPPLPESRADYDPPPVTRLRHTSHLTFPLPYYPALSSPIGALLGMPALTILHHPAPGAACCGRGDNVFVSIVESYSSDDSPALLRTIETKLQAMSVPNRILTHDMSVPPPTLDGYGPIAHRLSHSGTELRHGTSSWNL
ncbi:hypothetical protein B0H14DRAFT_3452792 [Mycena olivaceomarginata]|nr:hypothetical protein B0H14DRAFT_3452792 [Mycena olivaceomarginata]